ncbi:hypothetical protein TNCV_397311 [Trichonephila clavipes]|nr:hypothetical protein TNCV_397311 [Trichonephila clavipes]
MTFVIVFFFSNGAAHWYLTFEDLVHSSGAGITFECGTIQAIPISISNFDTQFPPQRETPELWRGETVLRILILPRAPKPNRFSSYFSCRIIIRDGRCRLT